jgi:murein DD-endopeptidase MepM/ murein hydrolase activator NlpD
MAQKQAQYEDAADSIFNFIFANAKKNIRPAKPLRPSEATGNEMADALSEIALRPATYVSDEVFSRPIKEIGDTIKLSEDKINVAPEMYPLKIEVNVGNFAEFVSDPESFIDAAFKKMEGIQRDAKKLNRIRGFGGIIDLGLGALAAKSAGYSGKEAIVMGWDIADERRDALARSNRAEELFARSVAFESASNITTPASVSKYEYADKLGTNFYHTLDVTRRDRAITYKLAAQDARKQVKTPAVQAHLTSTGMTESEWIKRYIIAEEGKIIKRDLINRYKHTNTGGELDDLVNRFAERENELRRYGIYDIKSKQFNLGNVDQDVRNLSDKDLRTRRQWMQSSNPSAKVRSLKAENLLREIAVIRQLPDTDPKKVELYTKKKKEFEFLKIWQKANGSDMKMSRLFGEISLHLKAFNEMVVQGKGFVSLINGDFWDVNRNHWSPSKTGKVTINAFDKDTSFDDIVMPRNDVSRYYTSFTSLYYLTPKSLARTFFVNGEGFVYLANLQQKGLQALMKKSTSLFGFSQSNPGLFDKILDGAVVNRTDSKEVLGVLGANYDEVINILEKNHALFAGTALEGQYKYFKLIADKLKNSKMLKYAKFLQKAWKRISALSPRKFLADKFRKLLLKVVGKKLYERLNLATVTLKSAIRTGVKAAIHAIGQALGVVFTGALANIVIAVVTEIIYFVAMKLLKVAVKVGTFLAYGVMAILLIMLIGAFSFFDSLNPFSNLRRRFNTAAQVPPIECEQCEVYTMEGVYDPSSGALEDFYDPDFVGDFIFPTSGRISSCYGPRWGRFHYGLDIAGPTGTPIYASKAGVVTRVQYITTGYGYNITIDHGDGSQTLYAHLSTISVQTGSTVSQGQRIATMGSTGRSTGPHLHFEIRIGGVRHNPCNYLDCGGSCS